MVCNILKKTMHDQNHPFEQTKKKCSGRKINVQKGGLGISLSNRVSVCHKTVLRKGGSVLLDLLHATSLFVQRTVQIAVSLREHIWVPFLPLALASVLRPFFYPTYLEGCCV